MEMKVADGMLVGYAYRLYDNETDQLLFEALSDRPDMMLYGESPEVVPGLAAAMKDLKVGDRFEVTLPPAAGFGERREENVLTLDQSIFMRDGKLADEVKVGAILPMMTQEGYRVQGMVRGIADGKVTMDFNHPFAGKTVRFEGEIVDVRKPTDEELKAMRGGGCGGCGGGCEGGCGDGGKSDGGCCGSKGGCCK
ncbi:MAG: FKBP-type peptidyl-prolyl cis-trans isomerase [Muribaculum sp.]|nr:FKBP-type peptidyl-prolyl cis-trans isomerase [Muribaculum sp.]